MYPEYLKIAEQEGNKQAAWSFDIASKVEKVHAGLFKKATQALNAKNDLEDASYYVCGVCGNTIEDVPPEKCPICEAPKTEFFEVT
jgi:rubrerythrin